MGNPPGSKKVTYADGSYAFVQPGHPDYPDNKSVKRSAGGASGASGESTKKQRSAELSPEQARRLLVTNITSTFKNMHDCFMQFGDRFREDALKMQKLEIKFSEWVYHLECNNASESLLKVFLNDTLVDVWTEARKLHKELLKIPHPAKTQDEVNKVCKMLTDARQNLSDFVVQDIGDDHLLKDMSDDLLRMIGISADPSVLSANMVDTTEDDDGNIVHHQMQPLNTLGVFADKLQQSLHEYKQVYDYCVNYNKFTQCELKIKSEIASVTTKYEELITNAAFKKAPPPPALNYNIMHRADSIVPVPEPPPVHGGSAAAASNLSSDAAPFVPEPEPMSELD